MRGKFERQGAWRRSGAVTVGAVVGLFLAGGMASVVLAASGHAPGDPKVVCPGSKPLLSVSIPGPAHAFHPKLVLSVTWKVVNDEDGGVVGYWALDTYTIAVQMWQLQAGPYANDYYWTQTESGIFQTLQGAHSPNNSAVEPAPGYGVVTMGAWGFVNNTTVEKFTPGSQPTQGYLGVKNYGGSTNSTVAGTYAVTGDTNMWFWYTAYFAPGYEADYTVGAGGGAWGYVYELNKAFWTPSPSTGATPSVDEYCIFGVPGSSTLFDTHGDIVTSA